MFKAAFTSAWQAKPQAVHRNTAWFSREPRSTCPHAEHRWLVNAGLTFSTRPGALSCSRAHQSSPHPDPRMPRFSPALARTLRPGFSRVPLADRVTFVTFRSSTRIRSNRRARSVDTFSDQSLRRSLSRACSRPIASPDPAAAVRAQPRAHPGPGELLALLQVARRARPARVPVGVLLNGQVPHVPGVAAVVLQHRLLGGRGKQPEPGHANTLSDTTDISGEVERRFLPGLKARVSTPRS